MREQNIKTTSPNFMLTALLSSLITLAIIAAIGYSYLPRLVFQSDLAALPVKVVTLDIGAMVMAYPKGTTGAEAEKVLAEVQHYIRLLNEQGYVVLDSAAMISGPEANVVDVQKLVAEIAADFGIPANLKSDEAVSQ